MTDKQKRLAVERYAKAIQVALKLDDWSIRFEWADLDENEQSRCWYLPEYRKGTVQFDNAFIKESPADIRLIVIHEFVHAHLERFDSFVRYLIKELSPTAQTMANEQARITVEEATTVFSGLLESGMPPFNWPK